jgi:cytochrome d ubiquinol oxidase subunit II
METELPLIWAGLIGTAVCLYVLLDGFDLGVGILFPFASPEEREQMVSSIAPVWDGNETWLVLGGGGLFAAFPLAYAILMPAMYLPIGLMLIALVFRGVAFEFRANAGTSGRGKRFWTGAFAGGSLVAGIAQGFVLGGFVNGIDVDGRNFAGSGLAWLTPYSLLVAAGLVLGYALLGACWLIIKTEGAMQQRARRWASLLFPMTGIAMAVVSVATLSVDPRVTVRWGVSMTSIDWELFLPVAPIPIVAALAVVSGWRASVSQAELAPFLSAVAMFLSGLFGLVLSLYPYLIPFEVTIWEAAAAPNAQLLMLVGALIMLPVILGYTAYVYWIFRGKVSSNDAYH